MCACVYVCISLSLSLSLSLCVCVGGGDLLTHRRVNYLAPSGTSTFYATTTGPGMLGTKPQYISLYINFAGLLKNSTRNLF